MRVLQYQRKGTMPYVSVFDALIIVTCGYVMFLAGLDIVRRRLALLDMSDNYSLIFFNGADNSDVFPGYKRKMMSIFQ